VRFIVTIENEWVFDGEDMFPTPEEQDAWEEAILSDTLQLKAVPYVEMVGAKGSRKVEK